MRKLLFKFAACLAVSPTVWAGPVFLVQFQARFDSGFGGLPTVQLSGSYTFEVRPPASIVNDGTTAIYPMQSVSFTLDGTDFAATPFEIRVDNNIDLGVGGLFRDAYYPFAVLTGVYATNFAIDGAGLQFEQVGAVPAAFHNVYLPTSAADLAGFGFSDNRFAVLTFTNLALGGAFATVAPVENLSFTAIPEPRALLMCGLGMGMIVCRHRKTKTHTD
jgi:hypothetical protein